MMEPGSDDDTIATYPARAFAFGSLTGLGFTILALAAFIFWGGIHDGLISNFADIAAGGMLVIFAGVLIAAIAFPFAGLAAAAALALMLWLEDKFDRVQTATVWSLTGLLFAVPAAWLFTRFHTIFSLLGAWIVVCGLIGGLAARIAYTWPSIRSGRGTRRERRGRRAS